MLNKALLMVVQKEKYTELVCRVKITVGFAENGLGAITVKGFNYRDEHLRTGSIEVIDGDSSVEVLCDYYNRSSQTPNQLYVILSNPPANLLKFVNETTGIVAYNDFYTSGSGDIRSYYSNTLLFQDAEVGQECVIAIYK